MEEQYKSREEQNWTSPVTSEWIKQCSYIRIWAVEMRTEARDAAASEE